MADSLPPRSDAALEPGAATPPPELLVVGRLVAAQGLAGELRVLPLSDFPERFTRPGGRWLKARDGPAQPVELRSGRQLPGKELFVVRIAGIDSRDAADALVGQELLVPAADRPPLEEGEFHLLDLVGLEVRLLASGSPPENIGSPAGGRAASEPQGGGKEEGDGTASGATEDGAAAVIGRVLDLIHAGNDLLEVELSAAAPGGRPRRLLIPFVEPIVPVVNLAEGWIGITPPPGLLEL